MFCKLLNGTVLSTTSSRLLKSPVRTFHKQHHHPHHEASTKHPLQRIPQMLVHRPIHIMTSVAAVAGGGSTTVRPASRVKSAAESAPAADDRQELDAIVPVSIASIRKTVRSGGLDLTDGYSCLRTMCPVCAPAEAAATTNKAPGSRKTGDSKASAEVETPSTAARSNHTVYINKTTGTVVCASCQIVRAWSTMESCFQRPAGGTAKALKEFEAVKQHFLKTKETRAECVADEMAVPIEQLAAEVVADVLRHLRIEMFSPDIFAPLGTLCDPVTRSLHFPLHDANGQTVGYKLLSRPDDELLERTTPDSDSFGVLVSLPKSQRDASSAVVVLNVVDLLALVSQKLTSSVVCLPHGSKSLPQHCLPALERFGRLTLWFHNDTVSWDTARTFAKKLDERRCVFVRPTESHPAPFAAHAAGLDMRAVLGTAQPVLHKAITTFAALRQDVLSEIQNIDKVQGVKWRRFPVLNKLLKGHRKGELTVLTGPTGCGKTTFMSEYSLDLTMQGVTTLWGSFEIRNTRLASTLLRQLAGHPFDERLAEFDRWANEFERLPMYFMTFHGQQSIKVVMETIEHAQYVHDIQHVIIDNVQFMMGTTDEPKHVDRFWRQDAIIGAFRTFATKKNCHVTLVIHPRKERDVDDLTTSSIFGGAKATQEADNVLIIQDKRLTAIRGKKYLQIAKNRYSGDLGIMPMDFDKVGLSYATKPKRKTDDEVGGSAEETPSTPSSLSTAAKDVDIF